jgi:hypothetical protein
MGPPLGVVDGDALEFERATHVDAARVEKVVTSPAERATWGAPAEPGPDETWAVEPRPVGCRYSLRLAGAAADPERAATWHALLIQLDLYLAAGVVHPADPATWRPAYEA